MIEELFGAEHFGLRSKGVLREPEGLLLLDTFFCRGHRYTLRLLVKDHCEAVAVQLPLKSLAIGAKG